MKTGKANQKTKDKVADLSPNIPIITLNVNGLYIKTERQRLAEWTKIHDPTICCPQETRLKHNNIGRLKVKRWEKTCHEDINFKKQERLY